MFNIHYKNNYSINDIKWLQNNGTSILRSAHIGNFNKATLLLAQEWFPILLHEFLSWNAPIYEPAYIKKQGSKLKVSDSIHSSQLHDNSFPQDVTLSGEKFQIPSQYHYNALKWLFPNIILSSESLLKQELFVQKVLDILSEDFPEMFYKYENWNGVTFSFSHTENGDISYSNWESKENIKKGDVANKVLQNLHQTRNCIIHKDKNPEGVIMNSLLYILISTLSEVYKDRNGDQRFQEEKVNVVHFSGTQMINYLSKNKKLAKENTGQLNIMFSKLQKELQWILPQEINFYLVPTDILDFLSVYKIENKNSIDSLLKSIIEISHIKTVKNQKQKEYAMGIMNRLQAMTQEDIVAKIISYRENIRSLTSWSKKKVSQTEKLISNYNQNLDTILANLVNIEISENNIHSMEEFQNLSQKEKQLQSNLTHHISAIEKENETQVTQYDLIENNQQLYIPNNARDISFNQLSQSLKKYKTKS